MFVPIRTPGGTLRPDSNQEFQPPTRSRGTNGGTLGRGPVPRCGTCCAEPRFGQALDVLSAGPAVLGEAAAWQRERGEVGRSEVAKIMGSGSERGSGGIMMSGSGSEEGGDLVGLDLDLPCSPCADKDCSCVPLKDLKVWSCLGLCFKALL